MDTSGMVARGADGAVRHGNSGSFPIADHRVATGRSRGHAHRRERRLRAVGRQKARVLAVKIAVFRARCISLQLLDGNARQRRLCRVCHPKGVFIRLLGQKAAAADGGIRFQRSSGCALAHRSRRAWQVARRLRGLTVRPLRRKASRLPLSSGRFRRTFALRRRLRRLPVRRLRLHGCAFFGQRSALRHSRRAYHPYSHKQGRDP